MSNKTKQTAIDIFKEKLINIFEDYHDGIITLDEYIESINKATQQAKEMEKQQRMSDFTMGITNAIQMEATKDAEQYYNETFGGNNEQQ